MANTQADAAREVEAVFTMLPDDHAVAEVVFGENGIAAGLGGGVHISSSTISVAFARQLANEHAKHGQQLVSACVFGRPDAAENRRLIVVSAGGGRALDQCRPLFEAIGRVGLVAGSEPWQANLLKLCGQLHDHRAARDVRRSIRNRVQGRHR